MTTYIEKNNEFYMRLAKIALPIATQQLVISSLNFVDTFMISSLGKASISGVGAANRLFFLLNLLLFGLSSGSSILTAQYWGKHDVKSIKKVYGLSLTLALVGAVVFALLAMLIPRHVIGLFSTDQEVILAGASYLRIVGISYVFTAITFATVFVLRSTNNVTLPMVITIIAIVMNTGLNYILIFGNLGFQPMGVEGAAIATTISRIVECGLIIYLVNKYDLPPAGTPKKIFVYTKEMTTKFLKIATPVVINEVLWSTGVLLYSVVYGRMSTDDLASMTITQTIEQISFVLIIGIGNATAIILGNDLGAGKREQVYENAKRFVRMAFVFGAIAGISLILIAPHVAALFDVSDSVYYRIVGSLSVFGLFMMFKCVNLIIIVGVLRSGGDTTFCAILDGGAVWFVGVPLGFLTGLVFKWDLAFVYICILMEEFVKVSFGVWRMMSKKWMKNLVEE